jgi:isopentenyl phosphate kinase
MPEENKVIELKLDVDGVYKSKDDLRKDIRPKKKIERAFVNNSSKINQFLFGVDVGVQIFKKLNKVLK